MPGSKRRALKNLLSPDSKPASSPSSPPPLTDSPSSAVLPTLSSESSSPTDQSTISLPASIGEKDRDKKPHSHTHYQFHLPHFTNYRTNHDKSLGGGSGQSHSHSQGQSQSHSHSQGHGHGLGNGFGRGFTFGHGQRTASSVEPDNSGSVMSIASDPGNYMSDQAVEDDLVVEQMTEWEHSGGSQHHRLTDGVARLGFSSQPLSPSTSPIPSHAQAQANAPPSSKTPPSTAVAGGMYGAKPGGSGAAGGGMYAPAGAVPVTAADLMGLNGGSGGRGGKKKSSRQKYEERQARKKEALLQSAPPSDPAWTAQLEKERQDEIRIIANACAVLGRDVYEVAPDGHCMFNAIADQLYHVGLVPAHQATNPLYLRRVAAQYMLTHPDDFMPFLPSINGEDAAGATDDGVITEKEFKKYCKNVEETGEWGGEPEIQALSRHFDIPIHVIQRGPPTIVSHGGNDDTFGGVLTAEQSASQGDRVVRISYHKRMYGLGEHYNSLRKAV